MALRPRVRPSSGCPNARTTTARRPPKRRSLSGCPAPAAPPPTPPRWSAHGGSETRPQARAGACPCTPTALPTLPRPPERTGCGAKPCTSASMARVFSPAVRAATPHESPICAARRGSGGLHAPTARPTPRRGRGGRKPSRLPANAGCLEPARRAGTIVPRLPPRFSGVKSWDNCRSCVSTPDGR